MDVQIGPYTSYQNFKVLNTVSPTDVVTLSTNLIQEITSWKEGSDLTSIIDKLNSFLSDISNVTDASTLTTIYQNSQQFDKIRAQKAQTADKQWMQIQSLDMQIDFAIITQQSQLPNQDISSLVQNIQCLINKVVSMYPQSPSSSVSADQISWLDQQVESLDKFTQSLSAQVQEQISQVKNDDYTTIYNLVKERILGDLQQQNLIAFEAAFADYIQYNQDAMNSMVNYLNQAKPNPAVQYGISQLFLGLFSIEKLSLFATLFQAINNGIHLPSIPGNCTLANYFCQTLLTQINQQSLLTVGSEPNSYIAYQNIMVKNLNLDLNPDIKLYFSNGMQAISDIAAAVESANRLSDIQKKCPGLQFYSHDQIQSNFGLGSVMPLLPKTLTVDLLMETCDYQPDKYNWQTHFLFYTPVSVGKSDFYTIGFKIKDSEGTVRGGAWVLDPKTIITSGLDPKVYTSSEGSWCLIYANNVTNILNPNDYQLITPLEMIIACIFNYNLGETLCPTNATLYINNYQVAFYPNSLKHKSKIFHDAIYVLEFHSLGRSNCPMVVARKLY